MEGNTYSKNRSHKKTENYLGSIFKSDVMKLNKYTVLTFIGIAISLRLE